MRSVFVVFAALLAITICGVIAQVEETSPDKEINTESTLLPVQEPVKKYTTVPVYHHEHHIHNEEHHLPIHKLPIIPMYHHEGHIPYGEHHLTPHYVPIHHDIHHDKHEVPQLPYHHFDHQPQPYHVPEFHHVPPHYIAKHNHGKPKVSTEIEEKVPGEYYSTF